MRQSNGDMGEQSASRRDVLRGIAAGGTGLAVLGGTTGTAAAGKSGDCEDVDFSTPRVDTVDHFDTTWYGSVYRTDGNTATNYDRSGEALPTGDELIFHVHGWRNGEACGIDSIELAEDAYGSFGYSAGVSGSVWGSDYAWWNAKEIADRTGPKLANFLTEYRDQNPGTTIRLQGHSLGAKVLCETLLALDAQGATDVVTSVLFFAGAVVDSEVAVSGEYGTAIENTVDHAENYWDGDDSVLNWAFSSYEWSWAIGNNGCNGTPPSNYTDHDVTDVVDAHWDEEYLNESFLTDYVTPTF